VRLERLDKLKTSNGLIWNRTRNFPACSIVPQSTTLPRSPCKFSVTKNEKCVELQTEEKARKLSENIENYVSDVDIKKKVIPAL
jgi:hypothetical protein